MADDYETLLELARGAQCVAAHLWRCARQDGGRPSPGALRNIAQEYAEARALLAGAEALRREREREAREAEIARRVALAARGEWPSWPMEQADG